MRNIRQISNEFEALKAEALSNLDELLKNVVFPIDLVNTFNDEAGNRIEGIDLINDEIVVTFETDEHYPVSIMSMDEIIYLLGEIELEKYTEKA